MAKTTDTSAAAEGQTPPHRGADSSRPRLRADGHRRVRHFDANEEQMGDAEKLPGSHAVVESCFAVD
jgi:hypothetical protein